MAGALQYFPLRIERIIQETADTRSFILSGNDINYIPGQFLTLVFDRLDGEEDRRNYSISSSPVLKEPLKITVKRIANGAYSRKLVDDAKEGDSLVTTGASGFFTLSDNIQEYSQLLFFAAGSGITPVIALIKTILYQYDPIRVVLFYSNASPRTTIFYDELKHLEELFPGRLHIDFLFSGYENISRRRLNIELIAEIARVYFFKTGGDSLFYLCGPFEYMRMITIILRTEGVQENRIRKEIFHIEKPAVKPLPPDVLPHAVTAQLGDKEYIFTAGYPSTILQSAKMQGVPLPYSCESGQCGTCAATCTSGNVWMWRNEVLMEDEIAAGRVLTCTGYAVNGDIKLVY